MTPTQTTDCNRDARASFAAPPGSEWAWRIVNTGTQKWLSRHRTWREANRHLTRMHKLAAGTAFEGLYVMEKIPNGEVSGRSQPSLASDSCLSRTAGSRPLDRWVRRLPDCWSKPGKIAQTRS